MRLLESDFNKDIDVLLEDSLWEPDLLPRLSP